VITLLFIAIARYLSVHNDVASTGTHDLGDDAPPNRLLNPAFVVDRRHWHSIRVQTNALVQRLDNAIDSVDGQLVNNVLVFDAEIENRGE
jgi:hypothetical protein